MNEHDKMENLTHLMEEVTLSPQDSFFRHPYRPADIEVRDRKLSKEKKINKLRELHSELLKQQEETYDMNKEDKRLTPAQNNEKELRDIQNEIRSLNDSKK
jgi:hypothetical protein